MLNTVSAKWVLSNLASWTQCLNSTQEKQDGVSSLEASYQSQVDRVTLSVYHTVKCLSSWPELVEELKIIELPSEVWKKSHIETCHYPKAVGLAIL
jgi:hypothetical protein